MNSLAIYLSLIYLLVLFYFYQSILYLLNQKVIEQHQIKKLANKFLQEQPEQQIQKEKQTPNTTEINLSNIELPAPPKIKRGRSGMALT